MSRSLSFLEFSHAATKEYEKLMPDSCISLVSEYDKHRFVPRQIFFTSLYEVGMFCCPLLINLFDFSFHLHFYFEKNPKSDIQSCLDYVNALVQEYEEEIDRTLTKQTAVIKLKDLEDVEILRKLLDRGVQYIFIKDGVSYDIRQFLPFLISFFTARLYAHHLLVKKTFAGEYHFYGETDTTTGTFSVGLYPKDCRLNNEEMKQGDYFTLASSFSYRIHSNDNPKKKFRFRVDAIPYTKGCFHRGSYFRSPQTKHLLAQISADNAIRYDEELQEVLSEHHVNYPKIRQKIHEVPTTWDDLPKDNRNQKTWKSKKCRRAWQKRKRNKKEIFKGLGVYFAEERAICQETDEKQNVKKPNAKDLAYTDKPTISEKDWVTSYELETFCGVS